MKHFTFVPLVLMSLCVATTIVLSKDDELVFTKDHVSVLPRTIVYLYNPMNIDLPVTFESVTSSGKQLEEDYYWPAAGDTMIASAASDKNSGVTNIAEFTRWLGTKKNTYYYFTQTIDLPGLGPILKLKQRMLGTATSTNSWIGIEAPGVRPAWFDDTQWHQVSIPLFDADGQIVADYVIDFCSYHWNKIKYQIGQLEPGKGRSVTDNALKILGVGIAAASSVALGALSYGDWSDAKALESSSSAVEKKAAAEKSYQQYEKLSGRTGKGDATMSEMASALRNEATGKAIAAVATVAITAGAVTVLTRGIPTPYANMLYKISLKKREQE